MCNIVPRFGKAHDGERDRQLPVDALVQLLQSVVMRSPVPYCSSLARLEAIGAEILALSIMIMTALIDNICRGSDRNKRRNN